MPTECGQVLLAYCLPFEQRDFFEIVNRKCKDRKCVNAQTKTGSMSEDGSTVLITPLTHATTGAIR